VSSDVLIVLRLTLTDDLFKQRLIVVVVGQSEGIVILDIVRAQLIGWLKVVNGEG
jgi:hypothetical protein